MKVHGTLLASAFVSQSPESKIALRRESRRETLKPLQITSQLNNIVDFFFGSTAATAPPNNADVTASTAIPFANQPGAATLQSANGRLNVFDLQRANGLKSTPSNRPNNRANRPNVRKLQKANAGPANLEYFNSVWDASSPLTIQGKTIRTWSFPTVQEVEAVQVLMKTNGRPLSADVDLWNGPNNNPQKVSVYIEDASVRPFNVAIATPKGQNAIAIQNSANMEFPLDACVATKNSVDLLGAINDLSEAGTLERIQGGGAVRTFWFSPSIASVQVLLETDGRPLNARVELLQGPNNNKQVMEIYADDGSKRPFFAVIGTPGDGNVVRIVNIGPLEFPLYACVEPLVAESGRSYGEYQGVVTDGGSIRESGFFSSGLPL